jgi:hypothetical protein
MAVTAMTRGRTRLGRRLRPFLIVLLMVLLAVLAGSFFWLPAFLKNNPASTTRIETLPAQAPAATLSTTAAALGGTDFELLDNPDGERIARDVDLYAWYASGPNATEATPSAPAPQPENTVPETSAPDTEEGGSAQ